MLEHERAHLMPVPAPFDGYVEKPARASSTCLVHVGNLQFKDAADALEASRPEQVHVLAMRGDLTPPESRQKRLVPQT